MINRPRPTLVGIQLLRGIAASMVVVSHSNTMMGHPEFFGRSPFPMRDTGGFGVNIFFVISGFIIAFVALDRDWRPRVSVREFAYRRFIRIVPFMWLCAIGYNALSYVGTHQVEWLPMIRALTLFPIGELKPNVLWSLRHEAIFYILFAIAMLGRRRHWWVLVLWFVAPIVYGVALLATGNAIAPAQPELADLLRVLLLGSDNGANLQFAAGFVLGLLYLRQSPLVRERAWGSLWLVTAVAVGADAVAEAAGLPMGLARSLLWTVLPLAIVWLGLVSPAREGRFARFAKLLGDASFSIYLVHNPSLLVLFKLARPVAPHVPLSVLYVGFVLIAVAAGIVVHLYVEKPLLAWLAHGRKVAPWQRPASGANS